MEFSHDKFTMAETYLGCCSMNKGKMRVDYRKKDTIKLGIHTGIHVVKRI